MDDERYEKGLRTREEVLGSEYVQSQLAGPAHSEFFLEWQRYLTEEGWGGSWTRPGIDRKTRSLVTLTVLATLGRSKELGLHLAGARRNGWTVDEIKEILIHLGAYAGFPAAVEAFRVAEEVIGAEASPTE